MENEVRLPECCLDALKILVEEGSVVIDKGKFDEIPLFSVDYGITPLIIIKKKLEKDGGKRNKIAVLSLIFLDSKNKLDIDLKFKLAKINKEDLLNAIIEEYKNKLQDFSLAIGNSIKLSREEQIFFEKIKILVEFIRSPNGSETPNDKKNTKLAEFPFFSLVQHGLKKWSGKILESKHPINLNYILIRDFLLSKDGKGKVLESDKGIEFYFFNGFSADRNGKYEKIMPLLVVNYKGSRFEQDKLIASIITSMNQFIKENIKKEEEKNLLTHFINILKYGNLKVSFGLRPVLGFNSTQLSNIIYNSQGETEDRILEAYVSKIKAEIYWLPKSTITGTIALKDFLHDGDSNHKFTYRGLKGIDGDNNENVIVKNIQEVIDRTNYSSNQNYLLVAPHGSGKESYANLIILTNKHRYRGKFITISAVGDTKSLLGQLFGERINLAVKSGLVEKAKNGALFIDEIGKSEPEFRSALLRFLQTGDYMRINGIEKLRRDHLLMIFASTDEDLEPLPPPPDFWDRMIRIDIDNPFKNILNLIDTKVTISLDKIKEEILEKLDSYEMYIKYLFLNVLWDYFENEIDSINPITMEIFKDQVLNPHTMFDNCEKFWGKLRQDLKQHLNNNFNKKNNSNKQGENKQEDEKILKKKLKEKFTFRYLVKFARDYVAEIYKKELIPGNAE